MSSKGGYDVDREMAEALQAKELEEDTSSESESDESTENPYEDLPQEFIAEINKMTDIATQGDNVHARLEV